MIADEIEKIRYMVEVQIGDSDTFEFKLSGTPAIQLARTLLGIEEQVRNLESQIIPQHLTNPPPKQTDKVVRLDLWKATQPERKVK